MKKHPPSLIQWNYYRSISLHNFPEGMAVFLGSIKGLRVGLNLALAIALHNIPEFHLNKFFTVFRYTLFSKKYTYLFPSSLDPEILEGLLGSVGGVMAFLTLHEMLPLAFDYVGQRQSVKAVFFGMAFMSASLYFLSIGLPEDMSL
ncbi:zinc transporter ZTP29-like [Arachis hypogaea]|uniref:zinc transporter ZTP29-like n=1 Tax=Arachis hypogaea TaxID=3818 RepID=UPI003B216186